MSLSPPQLDGTIATDMTIRSILPATFVVFLSWIYTTVRRKRSRFRNFPQLPSSLLLGHLKAFDQAIRGGIPDRHPGKIHLTTTHKKLLTSSSST